MRASGRMEKVQATEYLWIHREIATRECMKMTERTDRVLRSMLEVKSILASLRTVTVKAMECIVLKMVVSMKVSGRKTFNTDMEN